MEAAEGGAATSITAVIRIDEGISEAHIAASTCPEERIFARRILATVYAKEPTPYAPQRRKRNTK